MRNLIHLLLAFECTILDRNVLCFCFCVRLPEMHKILLLDNRMCFCEVLHPCAFILLLCPFIPLHAWLSSRCCVPVNMEVHLHVAELLHLSSQT